MPKPDKCDSVQPLKFADLWANYPGDPPYTDARTGKVPPGFENQCALKLSVALHGAGVSMKTSPVTDV
jgi:hypothetical protein